MKKSNLQTGMIIKTRAGQTALVIKDNCLCKDVVMFAHDNWIELDSFDEDLFWNNTTDRSEYSKTVDIMEVYKPQVPTEVEILGFPFLSLKSLECANLGKIPCIWRRVEKPSIQIEYLKDRTVITIFKNKLR